MTSAPAIPYAHKLANKAALSDREMEFLDRVQAIANRLASPGQTFRKVAEWAEDTYDIEPPSARRWVRKAREFIMYGVAGTQVNLQARYAANLESMIAKCSEHLEKDQVEVTIVSVPEAGGVSKVKFIKKKVTEKVLSPQVGNLMAKLMREHAIVTGARPQNNQTPRNVTVNNTTQNNLTLPGAAATDQLSADRLVELAFGDSDVKILPQQIRPTGLPAGSSSAEVLHGGEERADDQRTNPGD